MPHLQCTGRGRPTALSPLQMLWNNPLYPPGLVSDTIPGWIATQRAFSSLTTWLAHSKKKNCDVCKHSYSFTKGEAVLFSQGRFTMLLSVYAPDMPSRLPIILVIKRLIQQVLFGLLFILRGAIVGVIWLGLLPWVTVWAWRMYFSLGDSMCVCLISEFS